MGEPQRAAAAGRHRELPARAAQTTARSQKPRHRQSARRPDEGVPRLAAALCRPQARSS